MIEVTCRQAVELLLDYVDGSASARTRRALERHLRRCPRCVEFLHAYRATPAVVRRATAATIPPDAAARLRQRLAAAS